MVLPASPPDDAPRESSWLDSIRLELRLSKRGVLILVDNAQPERLREFIIALLPDHPDLIVETDVQSVYTVPEGSVMVLVPHFAEMEWLNQQRPVFARRGLKVILWCDPVTTIGLRWKAVDFFDWISHIHECPSGGVFAHKVYRLRAELCARRKIIHWSGGGIAPYFEAAFPGRKFITQYSWSFASLVTTIRSARSVWVFVGEKRAQDLEIIELALHEAQRRGRIIVQQLETVSVSLENSAYRHLKQFLPDEQRGGSEILRIAILADSDREAIALAQRCIARGIGRDRVERSLCDTAEPRAAMAQLAGVPTPFYASPSKKSERKSLEEYAAIAHKYAGGDDLALAESAARRVVEITEAPQWAATPQRAMALHALGRIQVRQGRFDAAEATFQDALRINSQHGALLLSRIGLDLADVVLRRGRYKYALVVARNALETLRAEESEWRDSELPESKRRQEAVVEALALVERIEKLLARHRAQGDSKD